MFAADEDDGFRVAHVDHIEHLRLTTPMGRHMPEHAVGGDMRLDDDDFNLFEELANVFGQDDDDEPLPAGYVPPSLAEARKFFENYLPHRIPDSTQPSG